MKRSSCHLGTGQQEEFAGDAFVFWKSAARRFRQTNCLVYGLNASGRMRGDGLPGWSRVNREGAGQSQASDSARAGNRRNSGVRVRVIKTTAGPAMSSQANMA